MAGGVAVSFNIQFNAQKQLQHAVDSAVLAGTSLPSTATDTERENEAGRFFEKNVEALIGGHGEPNFTLEIVGKPVFEQQSMHLVGDVSGKVANPLGGIIDPRWLTVRAHSAARKQLSEPVCVLGLDSSQPATIDFNGYAELRAPHCAVQANSRSGSAIRQVGQPYLEAKAIGVSGRANGTGYSVPPVEGTAALDDPYADLDFPPSDPCPESGEGLEIQGDTVTLEPGTYCGGLTLMAGAEVTFRRGVYVFKDGPLWLISGARAQGEEVMFAFAGEGSTLHMNENSELSVSSPMTGDYKNIQFFGDPGIGEDNPWGVGLIGDVKLTYDGAMYFPGQNIWIGGESIVDAISPSYAIVADQIWIHDQSVVNVRQENARGLEGYKTATGFGFGATLVE